MNLDTPLYDLKCFPNVYEPREDTFLLLDALEKDLETIKQMDPKYAVEIGSGSGIVITALSNFLKNNCICFATDINPEACKATKATSELNNCIVEVVNTNLLDSYNVKFDVILFNPPYVVTDSSEIVGNGLSRAWAGGSHGREIVEQLLFKLPLLLSENGLCYVVILKENNPALILKQMLDIGIKGDKVFERKIPSEHLFVYRFTFCSSE